MNVDILHRRTHPLAHCGSLIYNIWSSSFLHNLFLFASRDNMPYFRGIEISIHASLEARQVTEYPHPDGSSVRLLRPTTLPVTCGAITRTSRATQLKAPFIAEDIDPTRLKKVNPRISVYIPSLPGTLHSLFLVLKIMLTTTAFRRAVLAALSDQRVPTPLTMRLLQNDHEWTPHLILGH